MPTAAKLIAAVLFGTLAWFASDLVKPLLPEGSQVGMLSPINALFGVIMGWRVMGRRAGDGMVAAMGYGLTTIVAVAFWSILLWAGYEMLKRSVRMYYDGPVEALQEMASFMLEYAQLIATGEILGALIVGSIVAGWLTEFFSRRWS